MALLFSLGTLLTANAQQGKHLFMLSGQSNMARLNPEESFTPLLAKTFGSQNIVVVKHAVGGQPIRRWYKNWKAPADKPSLVAAPDLYDSLMLGVQQAIGSSKPATVTFIWMQGEREAREGLGDLYKESLLGLYQQVCEDFQRTDINFIIGRLSDFGISNAEYPDWNKIRDIEMQVAASNPRFAWIDTDDLNDGADRNGKMVTNDLHMSAEGYKTMGIRFAQAAIRLLQPQQ